MTFDFDEPKSFINILECFPKILSHTAKVLKYKLNYVRHDCFKIGRTTFSLREWNIAVKQQLPIEMNNHQDEVEIFRTDKMVTKEQIMA